MKHARIGFMFSSFSSHFRLFLLLVSHRRIYRQKIIKRMLAFQTPSRPSDPEERTFIDGTTTKKKTVDVRRLLSPPMLIRKSQFRWHASENTQVSQEDDDLVTHLSARSSFNLYLLGDVQSLFEGHGSAATSSCVPHFPPLSLQDDATVPESPSDDLSSSSSHIRLRPRKRIRGCILPLPSR